MGFLVSDSTEKYTLHSDMGLLIKEVVWVLMLGFIATN